VRATGDNQRHRWISGDHGGVGAAATDVGVTVAGQWTVRWCRTLVRGVRVRSALRGALGRFVSAFLRVGTRLPLQRGGAQLAVATAKRGELLVSRRKLRRRRRRVPCIRRLVATGPRHDALSATPRSTDLAPRSLAMPTNAARSDEAEPRRRSPLLPRAYLANFDTRPLRQCSGSPEAVAGVGQGFLDEADRLWGAPHRKDEAWPRLAVAHTVILPDSASRGRRCPLPVWFVAIDRHVYVAHRRGTHAAPGHYPARHLPFRCSELCDRWPELSAGECFTRFHAARRRAPSATPSINVLDEQSARLPAGERAAPDATTRCTTRWESAVLKLSPCAL